MTGSAITPRRWALGLLVATACAGPKSPDQATRWCDQIPREAFRSLEQVIVSDPWFEVYRVESGVFAIAEPYQFQEVISYLIVGSRSALLFDTGLGIGRISSVVAELTNLPVRVLNSHTHFDHVGGNAEFEQVLGVNTDYTREHAKGAAPGTIAPGTADESLASQLAPNALCRPLPAGVTPDSYAIRPFTIARWVQDGDTVMLGDRTLEIIGAPGHTPDALALLDRKNGLLWTGDTFYAGPIWLFVPETDLDAYAGTTERLARLAPDLRRLLPAHNTPTASPSRLTELPVALKKIREGKVKPTNVVGRQAQYSTQGYTFLLAVDSAVRKRD